MNYSKIYDAFISDRMANAAPSGYAEKHHIIPKSVGGSNRAENIIHLAPGDHLFAHQLLARIYKTRGLWFALVTMSSEKGMSARGTKANRTLYENARKNYALALVDDHPNKGKPLSAERRAQISATSPRLSGADHPMFGKSHSEETRAKMRASNWKTSGKDHPMFGRKHSTEAIQKLKDRWKMKPHPSIKNDVWHFTHVTGESFIGSRYEFCLNHGISRTNGNLSRLIQGKVKSVKGWSIRHD